MKLRSGVLVACMVVVPAVALFPQRVRLPDGLRDALHALVVRVGRQGGTAGFAPSTPARETTPPDDENTVRTRLAALGATAIECRPLPGSEGAHLASCRVAVDARGELERVFQAQALQPADALRELRDDVAAWRDRIAARPAHAGTEATF